MVVQAPCWNPDHYLHEEIYRKVDQVVNMDKPLNDINESQFRALSKSFCNCNYDHARRMMTVYNSFTVKANGTTYVTAVHNVEGLKLLKAGYCMVMLDGRYQRRYIKMERDKNCVEWVMEPLRMGCAFGVHGMPISPVQAIKLSNIANISTTISRCKATFSNTKQSLLRYLRVFKEQYGVRLLECS